EVERDQRPSFLLALGHEPGEVEDRAGQPVELGDHERPGLASGQPLERPDDPGPLQVLGAVAGVLDDLRQLPASPLALGDDRLALRLEAGAGVGLLVGRHPDVAEDGGAGGGDLTAGAGACAHDLSITTDRLVYERHSPMEGALPDTSLCAPDGDNLC